MKPINFPESNFEFKKPEDMEEDECGPLPVHHCVIDGNICNISCWEPSEEEIQEIIKTKKVWLLSYGMFQQPVAVTGTTPFEETK